MVKSIQLSVGRKIGLKNGKVVVIDQRELIPAGTESDHGVYEDDYVTVSETKWYSVPISDIENVFDPDTHVGAPFDRKWMVSG